MLIFSSSVSVAEPWLLRCRLPDAINHVNFQWHRFMGYGAKWGGGENRHSPL